MRAGRFAAAILLAAAVRPAAAAECFYPESGGEPKRIACPESAVFPDKVPPPPPGIVWRSLGDHQYQPELLLRKRGGKILPDKPGLSPYDFSAIQVDEAGQTAPLGLGAARTPRAGASATLRKAITALQGGDAHEAAARAGAAIDENPSPQAFYIRAMAYNKLGLYAEAMRDCESGLALAPDDPMLQAARSEAGSHLVHHEEKSEPAPKDAPPAAGAPVLLVAGVALMAAGLGAGGGFWLAQRAAAAKPGAFAAAAMPQIPAPPATPVPGKTDDRPPIVLKGRFQLKKEIGTGGMGVVYDGWDLSLGRRVAIKQMRSELKNFPDERAAFLGEARIISHLSHPYIVGFHDVVEEGGEIYLVFDFVDGRPLSQILWEKKRLSLPEVQKIYTYVCEAISCAHHNHVLHRDLKPSNIMVDARGYAKVMDFGIAREAKETITRLTHADTAGTPWYMAPEQHLGRCAKASDIYALGVCLYESLTGKLPFPGPDFLAQKERMKYPPPQFLAPELPKETELLFAATLNPDPKKRVADAAELLESLKSLKAA
jgi:hypothetical protein